MLENSLEKLVDMDIDRIYLGNLSTVETDISLPLKGENGTSFDWQSSNDYLLTKEGRVSRPHFGAGNRQVTLILTATNQGITKVKTYTANVLEKEYPFTIERVYPITVYTKVGKLPELPSVMVASNNLGEDIVVSVEWEKVKPCMVEKEGDFAVKGSVKDNVASMAEVIVTDNENLLMPKLNIKKEVQSYNAKNVKLLPPSDFYNQQQRVLECLLNVDDESMLYNFRSAAGVSTNGASPMTGWDAPECRLKGHTTGHYLSALALCFGATGNEKIKAKLDYMVDELYMCQQEMAKYPDKFASGFLSGYDEEQFDLLEEYTTYPTIWAPYYTLHKIMAGLRDCYIQGENSKALKILKGIGLWVYNRLSKLTKDQRDKMWAMYIAGEFGGINEVLADLYMLTMDERYLTASKYFDNVKLYLPMKMRIDALGNLHANQHIPQIIGCLRQFDVTKEKDRFEIADAFWNFVTKDHIYSIGGTGETEMFKPARQIARFISEKTAESCASYNMLKLTGMLYEYNSDSRYMDYYETTVTNHILSSGDISAPTGGSTYFMSVRPGAQKGFNVAENSCCHGTGLENHFKYGEYIYAKSEDSLFINLFIPSSLQANDADVELSTEISETNLNIKVKVNELNGKSLKIRKPLWAKDIAVEVNGSKTEAIVQDGYINFEIQNGIVELLCSCSGYLSKCIDDEKTVSVCWGPYVLAAISKQSEFIMFDVNDETVGRKLLHDGHLNFMLEEHKLMPLNRIDKENYHVYVKIK
ncbi:MAG: beta-L-arabinofuranosidase domain-containing protein [Sedimentibacter sp.]|uniref:beta-L-arabinofuranosidase domain-containing protein n=1 Tax=Sedimentibacter sp. TaxID=1960295 RepID=UPI0031598F0D